MSTLISNVVFIIFTFLSGVGIWQLALATNLSRNLVSCGGDFSINASCPIGAYCQSLDQGKLAGGVCAPWIATFLAFDSHTSDSRPQPTPKEATIPRLDDTASQSSVDPSHNPQNTPTAVATGPNPTQNPNGAPITPTSPTAAPKIKIHTYHNEEIGIEFQYPDDLLPTEVVDEYSLNKEGALLFCEGKSRDMECQEGLTLNYGIPTARASSASCEESAKASVRVGSNNLQACRLGSSYAYIRLRHPKGKSEVILTVSWGPKFSQEASEKILSSFRFLD